MNILDFTVNNLGSPQQKYTKWYATPNDESKPFLVGYTTNFSDGDGSHIGLNTIKFLKEMPRLYYDRLEAAGRFGLWAHFIWPTVVAESCGGCHLMVNTYDRARFTFGFCQLAAHTPNDNLILLFRGLLTLPSANSYFPDLSLINGVVHANFGGQSKSLEMVTSVRRPNGRVEDQIVGFMSYLNPDTHNIGDIEVKNAARLQHWLLSDPNALAASEQVVMSIMIKKIKSISIEYNLIGKAVELAIWVLDITHQGRGSKAEIHDALSKPNLQSKLSALYEVGSRNGNYDSRRNSVKQSINTLVNEGVFNGILLGDKQLSPN